MYVKFTKRFPNEMFLKTFAILLLVSKVNRTLKLLSEFNVVKISYIY